MLRDATLDDIPDLILLGERMHNESIYACLRYSPSKVAETFSRLIDSERGLFLVAERAGAIVGFVTASAGEPYFSDEIMVTEHLVYMTPENRGTITAVRLLMAFVQWAKRFEPKLITAGITTGVTMRESAELYQRIGFDLMGYVFKWSDG